MATITGKPAVVPASDGRQAIANIAERLKIIEAQVNLLSSYATANQSPAALAQLSAQISALTNQIESPTPVEVTVDAEAAVALQVFSARPATPTPENDAQRVMFAQLMAPRPAAERPFNDAQQILAAQSFARR